MPRPPGADDDEMMESLPSIDYLELHDRVGDDIGDGERSFSVDAASRDEEVDSTVGDLPQSIVTRERNGRCIRLLSLGPRVLDQFRKCRRSLRLAFLSHICFLLGSMSYVMLSFLDMAWFRTTHQKYRVPDDVLGADDDETWYDWTSSNGDVGSTVEDLGEAYYLRSKLAYVLGAGFFVAVGTFDWVRYRDVFNVFMILAGAAGVAGGLSDTGRGEAVWNCVSVHLYLLEACNMMRRNRSHDGDEDDVDDDDDDDDEEERACFRFGNLCFLAGSVLDIFVSYLDLANLAGHEELMIIADMTANMLWLVCSLIELGAEMYFLKGRR